MITKLFDKLKKKTSLLLIRKVLYKAKHKALLYKTSKSQTQTEQIIFNKRNLVVQNLNINLSF